MRIITNNESIEPPGHGFWSNLQENIHIIVLTKLIEFDVLSFRYTFQSADKLESVRTFDRID